MLAVLIVVIMIWIYFTLLLHPRFKSYEYEEIKHRFKTGDIILFHALDNINPIFIGCYYGHIGMVYIDPDDEKAEPQIFEAFNTTNMPFYPPEYSNGIALANLKHRLNSYRGYCFYKELEKPLDIRKQRKFKEFINYALKSMYYNESVVSNAIKKIILNDKLRIGTNCGELVYISLIKLGLLDENYIYENRRHHLLWLSKINEVNDNIYIKPVYVLSNYFIK